MDEDTLQNAKVVLDSTSSHGILLAAIDERLNDPPINPDDGSNSETRPWRVLVRDAVQAIIEPHVLDWMDDDDSLTDHDLIVRALAEVDARFVRKY